MKIFAVIASATAASALHYTEVPHCTAKIAQSINAAANNFEGLAYGDRHSLDIMGSLQSMCDDFQSVQEVVKDCRKIAHNINTANKSGKIAEEEAEMKSRKIAEAKSKTIVVKHEEVVPMTSNIANVTIPANEENNCLSDVETLVSDSIAVAKDIVAAVKDKSIPELMKALTEAKNVEADVIAARTDCNLGTVISTVQNMPCAKAINKVVHKIEVMGKDLSAIVHKREILRVASLQPELEAMPTLVKLVAEKCTAEVAMLDIGVMQVPHIKRRGLFDGLDGLDGLVNMGSAAIGAILKKAAEAACFGDSISVADQLENMVGQFGHGIRQMNATGTIGEVSDLHDQVSDAMISCKSAVILQTGN